MPISLKGQLIMTHYSRRRTNGQIHRMECRLCHCDRSGSDRDGGVQMKQLGDITKINGAAIEPVDVITGGSPCQDLSVAGKRAGLSGERSGLFMEMVRVIKEMRNASKQLQMRWADVPVRPRFVVWENVYGAFGSNGGEDFRTVLEEFCRIEGGQTFQFLDLRTEIGASLDVLSRIDGASLGAEWTVNIGESPNEEKESRLFSIMEDNPPRKYYLSRKSCDGILRRAEARGRKLSTKLEEALKTQHPEHIRSLVGKIKSADVETL